MKRLLDILFVLASFLTIYVITNAYMDDQKHDNNISIEISSDLSTLDIPLNNQAHKYSSKEFTAPTTSRTINNNAQLAISIIASYTLHKRVNNISSHSTNCFCYNSQSHKYISYGILRV